MKLNSRPEDTATIAELESRLESVATYLINQDTENMRLNQRIVNLELIIAKMQHQMQAQYTTKYNLGSGTISTGPNGASSIDLTQP